MKVRWTASTPAAGGLDDASFFGDVAIEDSEATILTEGVGEVGDDQKRAR